MRFTLQFASSALAAIVALSACATSGNRTIPGMASQQSSLLAPARRGKCPRKYTLGCATVSPSGPGETITFSCSSSTSCPPKFTMHNRFYTVDGRSAKKDLVGIWDPNPFYPGLSSTYTINLVSERRALKPSNKVEYFETLSACPARSRCRDLGTVGLIPLV